MQERWCCFRKRRPEPEQIPLLTKADSDIESNTTNINTTHTASFFKPAKDFMHLLIYRRKNEISNAGEWFCFSLFYIMIGLVFMGTEHKASTTDPENSHPVAAAVLTGFFELTALIFLIIGITKFRDNLRNNTSNTM